MQEIEKYVLGPIFDLFSGTGVQKTGRNLQLTFFMALPRKTKIFSESGQVRTRFFDCNNPHKLLSKQFQYVSVTQSNFI